MIYLESSSTDPAFNLALEQFVFEQMDRRQEYFMLWQNANTVVVGKNQNTFAEVNQRAAEARGVRVVRRLSGGGAVYHDLGNLNFTFIMDAENAGDLDIRLFCQPIAELLRSLGVPAEVNGRNDITIEGRKFSGNAFQKNFPQPLIFSLKPSSTCSLFCKKSTVFLFQSPGS